MLSTGFPVFVKRKQHKEKFGEHMRLQKMRLITSAAILILILGIMIAALKSNEKGADSEMTNMEFFKSLDYEDGTAVTVQILKRFPVQYAATLGTDGNAQIRPIEFKFEEDGVFYFDTVIYYESYKELQENPYIQLCVCDPETMTYIRLGGKVNFTEDEGIINRCFEESTILTSQFGENRDVVIGYYLTEAWAEFQSFSEELQGRTYTLKNKYDVENKD